MSARIWIWTGVVSASAGCQFSHGVSNDSGACPTASSQCVGDVLHWCPQPGIEPVEQTCEWGCLAEAGRCAELVPSGNGGVLGSGVGVDDVDGTGLADTTIAENITLDTDTGRIGFGPGVGASQYHGVSVGIDRGIDFQVRGPVAMWRFRSLTLTGNATVLGTRPFALVADGAVTINGVVSASGTCMQSTPGPGGFAGGSTAGGDGTAAATTMGAGRGAPANDTGGGGGAHGGAGGNADNADGGKPYGDAAITLLVGGAGGGAGNGGGMFGRGGGGGGAIQIVSNTRIDIASGGINAGGCGGKAGGGANDSGGGGGAGGAILLEAPTVIVAGTLAANGGGGGGGSNEANAGANGQLSTTPAPGGDGGDNNDSENGGAGAASKVDPGVGLNGSNPGGGGGGLGRIRINTRGGTGATLTQATLSPGEPDPAQFTKGSATTQ